MDVIKYGLEVLGLGLMTVVGVALSLAGLAAFIFIAAGFAGGPLWLALWLAAL